MSSGWEAGRTDFHRQQVSMFYLTGHTGVRSVLNVTLALPTPLRPSGCAVTQNQRLSPVLRHLVTLARWLEES